LILDKKRYALKYSVIYGTIIAIILIAPLFVYIQIMVNINEAKIDLELKKKAHEVINQIDRYKPLEDEYFHFPRFNSFEAGLYTENFKPIFTLIDDIPLAMNHGYYSYDDKRFYVIEFSDKKYFDATYLVVKKDINNYEIYQVALLIVLSILIMLFILSYFIFKNFALPFEKINQKLDNFIKDSIHEINTPLSIININIDMFALKHGENRYLTRIKAASKTLATIYNDMDYLIKQDRASFEKESLDMSSFIMERVDYFRDIAKLKELEIQTDIEDDITLYFNKTKLQRIVDNTLSNAVKYSYEKNYIDVTLEYKNNSIVFIVRDYGVGIEKSDKVFERYYRENLNKGGFGIGLNIVKQIIDENSIELEIISKPKKGSSFIYIFNTL
jgi:signal transduction histidine kinase